MANAHELESKFWDALKSDLVMMVGVTGAEDGHMRPMTAQLDGGEGPIWFFTAKDTSLVQAISGQSNAHATFVSKDHDVFACIHGSLAVETNRAMIDRLWNRYVEAWFEGGKNDPKLELLRFDAREAEVWLDASSLVAGIKMMFGISPREDYKDSAGKVKLG